MNYAEGSGADYENDDGDSRLVAGCEVLVGRNRYHPRWDGWMKIEDGLVGRRCRVVGTLLGCDSGLMHYSVDVGESFASLLCRDAVVLRDANGNLTEYGEALELLGSTPWQIVEPMRQWLIRAGIMASVPTTDVDGWRVSKVTWDAERLDAALTVFSGDIRNPDLRHFVDPEIRNMCWACRKQTISPKSLKYCADCASLIVPRPGLDVVREPGPTSRYLDDLRRWFSRPLGG